MNNAFSGLNVSFMKRDIRAGRVRLRAVAPAHQSAGPVAVDARSALTWFQLIKENPFVAVVKVTEIP